MKEVQNQGTTGFGNQIESKVRKDKWWDDEEYTSSVKFLLTAVEVQYVLYNGLKQPQKHPSGRSVYLPNSFLPQHARKLKDCLC